MALLKKKDDSHDRLTSIENRLAVCQQYTKLWHDYFRFFSEELRDKRISDQEEQAFFQLMYVLASNQYRFVELAGRYFKDGDGILKVLTDTVSLQAIKQMSDAQYSQLLVDWHTIFIMMNKAIGKLKAEFQAEEAKKKPKK
ncbi:MAG: hypothetical protein N2Z21_08185 [Candidatus Sumerlaeaceae bacterium]|nr:hypothetical protein [Candidatus Sumerlaeaceae bacterium]